MQPQPRSGRERTRSVMGRLETSSTAAARKSCLTPTTSGKSTPTLGLPERRLLFEFQQNQEDSLLRLAHLLKANSDHLRDMLQWTTTEFNERPSTRNQTRIPRMSSVMPAETALRRLRRKHQLRLLRARLYNMLRAFGVNNQIGAYRLGRFHTANVELVDEFCRELVREETGVLPSPYVSRSTSPQTPDHSPTATRRRSQPQSPGKQWSTTGVNTDPLPSLKENAAPTRCDSRSVYDLVAVGTQCETTCRRCQSTDVLGLRLVADTYPLLPQSNNNSLLMISRPCDSVGDMLHSKEVRPCYPDGFVQKATEERSCCSDLGMQKVEEPRPCDPDGSTHKALEARPCDTHGGVKQAPEIRLARAAYINECRDSADLAPKLSKNGPLVAPSVRRLHSLPNLMINIDDATDKTVTSRVRSSVVTISSCDDDVSMAASATSTPCGSRQSRLNKPQIVRLMAELRCSMDDLAQQAHIARDAHVGPVSRRSAANNRRRRTSDLKKWRELLKQNEQQMASFSNSRSSVDRGFVEFRAGDIDTKTVSDDIKAWKTLMSYYDLAEFAGKVRSMLHAFSKTINIESLQLICKTVRRHIQLWLPNTLLAHWTADNSSSETVSSASSQSKYGE
ncbi:hypothetical protein LSAT2_007275 [Lamellibrachia satsuma]|nr:hypothetical protein LSAT2_007275 [Lamellibrachia satsuma]